MSDFEFSFTLLIIYRDGSRKSIPGVTDYFCDKNAGVFWFNKNGYKSFVPIDTVLYFGREFDYNEA